jgi:hypothetical protein
MVPNRCLKQAACPGGGMAGAVQASQRQQTGPRNLMPASPIVPIKAAAAKEDVHGLADAGDDFRASAPRQPQPYLRLCLPS